MKHRTLVLFLALATLPLAAQTPATPAPATTTPTAPAVLTVADILSLHKALVSDSVIIARLTQQNHPIPLTTGELIQLKSAGLSDAVVRVMLVPAPPVSAASAQNIVIHNATTERLRSMNPTGATPPYAPGDTLDIDDPLAPHDSGIYLDQTAPTGDHMLFLDRAGIGGVKANAGAVFSFFAYPVTFKYEITAPRAQVRTSAAEPVFYFYFDDKSAGLGKSIFSAANVSSPTQFTLVRLDAGKKERELPAMKFGIFVGVSNGEKQVQFTSQRLRAGLYKVTLKQPLKPGEYAFVSQPAKGTAATNVNDPDAPQPDVFDFGVDTQVASLNSPRP